MKYGILSTPQFARDSMRRAALSRFLARLPEQIEIRNEIAARYEALSLLTNAQLAEVGIARDDIPRIAVLGADG